MIEPWGKDSLRVRSTMEPVFIDRDWALTEKINHGSAKISVTSSGAEFSNGKVSAKINPNGVITFYKDDKVILHEYYRSYDPSATNGLLKLQKKWIIGLLLVIHQKLLLKILQRQLVVLQHFLKII